MQTIVPKIAFITYSLGCRTNQAELEVISDQLSATGLNHIGSTNTAVEFDSTQYLITNTKPDIILINTCMVTQKAERETRKAIRHFCRLYPKAKIVVLGCAVTAKNKFKIILPEADLLISNEEKNKAVESILKYCDVLLCDRIGACHFLGSIPEPKSKSDYEESGRNFIKIQDGCDNYCSFCITAYLRGEPKSEKPEKLINTINEFQPKADRPWVETNSKIKEIVLTGINIALYGQDLKPKINIWDLVNRILKETKIERLTLSTVYPEMLYAFRTVLWHRTVLCDTIKNPRLTRCFHLALQSGSPTVLCRMNRPTDLKKLLKAIDRIREIQPDFTFRADVIAGFPGETEDEYHETLEFLKKAKISFAHVFPYSPRVGTVAYQMIKNKKWQDLPMEVKKRRAGEIRLLVGKLSSELSREMIGKTFRTLIIREVEGGWDGITENGWNILIQSSKCKVQSLVQNAKLKTPTKGSIVEIKITGYEKCQLLGEILSLPI